MPLKTCSQEEVLEAQQAVKLWEKVAVTIDEAANWVAFGNFAGPHYGPRKVISCPRHGDRYDDESGEREGRLNLANEMLFAALQNGVVTAFGVFIKMIRHDDHYTYDEPDHVLFKVIDKSVFAGEYEFGYGVDDDDGTYGLGLWLGDGAYIDLLVDWDQLQAAFPWRLPVSPVTEGKRDALQPQDNRRGRPKKHDWESFLREVVRIANCPDGLPERMAQLEQAMAIWCLETWGYEPSESQIRDKLAPLYRRLDVGGGEAEKI